METKEIVKQLRGLADPSAEALSDFERINLFVAIARPAADRLASLTVLMEASLTVLLEELER